MLMFWIFEYPLIVMRRINAILRYLWEFLSLDLVVTRFFTPYKKANNIAGWTVGILFKLAYLVVVLPLFIALAGVFLIIFVVVPLGIPIILILALVTMLTTIINLKQQGG